MKLSELWLTASIKGLQDIEDVLSDPLRSLTQPAVDVKGSAEGRKALRHAATLLRHQTMSLPDVIAREGWQAMIGRMWALLHA